MKKTLFIPLILPIIILVLGCFSSVQAKDPWQWQFSLRGDHGGKDSMAMVLPTGMFVDKKRDRYYVADTGNNRLLSFDSKGLFLNAFRAGDKLKAPYDIVREENGVFWLVEKERNALTSIDLQARDISSHSLAYRGVTVYPDRLFLEGENLFVLDKSTGDIVVYNKDLKPLRHFGCTDCRTGFIDFTLNSGKVWALAKNEKTVYVFSQKGGKATRISLNETEVDFPFALEIGPAGMIYVLDRHQGKIAVFDKSGVFKYRFLGKGHDRGKLYYPEDLLFDPWGRLCVVDAGNGRVEVFSR